MKKVLALALALVLTLGLATVAFAATFNGELGNDTAATYHIPTPGLEGNLIKVWGCFDAGTQISNAITFVYDDNDDGVAETQDILREPTADNTVKYYDFKNTTTWVTNITANAALGSVKVVPTYVGYAAGFTGGPLWTSATPTDTELAAAESIGLWSIVIEVTPNDPVCAINQTIKGNAYAYNNNAQTTNKVAPFDFEIELRNHYIDVYVDANGDAAGTAPVWKNATRANEGIFGYTAGHNDIADIISIKEALILHRYHNGGNTSTDPAYVVYTEQFKTSTAKAVTFTYDGLVSVTFSDTKNQTGINFKYNDAAISTTDEYDEFYGIKGYKFNFLSKELVDSETKVTFDAANVRAKTGNTCYVYYSADEGKTYTEVALDSNDITSAKTIELTLEAGNVLGWYLFSDTQLNAADAETGKENVGTGANDMVSVCVALAVVSLVAAGAVCVKKVSK